MFMEQPVTRIVFRFRFQNNTDLHGDDNNNNNGEISIQGTQT